MLHEIWTSTLWFRFWHFWNTVVADRMITFSLHFMIFMLKLKLNHFLKVRCKLYKLLYPFRNTTLRSKSGIYRDT